MGDHHTLPLHALGAPFRRLRHERVPDVARPDELRPGDPPGVGDRLLVLYDGDCGVCLHGRDWLSWMDRRGNLAADVIQRHAEGLLADLSEDERTASWHVIHPDGRREERGRSVAAVVSALPYGRLPSRVIRLLRPIVGALYESFSHNRAAVSQSLGLTDHPDKGVWTGVHHRV